MQQPLQPQPLVWCGRKPSNTFHQPFLNGNEVALMENSPYPAFHIQVLYMED